MMRFFLLTAISFGLLFVYSQPVQALSFPEPKVKNAKAVYISATAVQIRFEAKNFISTDSKNVTIHYRRDEQSSFPFSQTSMYFSNDGIYYAALHDLLPNTRYYYEIKVSDRSDEYSNGVKTFKTNALEPMITDIQPRTVSEGDVITITGQGFAASGTVGLGYGAINDMSIISWSNDTIVAQVPADVTDGPVTLSLYPYSNASARYTHGYRLTMQSDIQLNVLNESHAYHVACNPSGVIADTYEAVLNFDQLYREEFGRPILCEELVFHLQHSTPHDRLQTWLNAQTDGQWWDTIMSYDGQVIYNSSNIFYVNDGKLYDIPDMMTALAWGLMPDDAMYVNELSVSGKRADALYAATDLAFLEGPYYRDVITLSNGEDADFDNAELKEYATAKRTFIDGSKTSFKADVCDLLTCGEVL